MASANLTEGKRRGPLAALGERVREREREREWEMGDEGRAHELSPTPRRLGTGLLVVSKPEANDEAKGLELEGAWMGQNGAEWTKS